MERNSSTERPETNGLWQWLPEFFRHELAPYPGRQSLVMRMVIAAVLSMIIIVTFRIPYGAIGVNCAFILSRENLLSTAKSGFYFIFAFAVWALLTPVGARMFASIPITHFFWEAITVFLCFYLLKTVTYFPLAAGFVVVATGTLAIWYLPGPAEFNVELTLWQILATAIGAVVTLLVEVVFHYFAPANPLRDGLVDRLRSIEVFLDAYGVSPSATDHSSLKLTQYAMTGSSMLRQQIARSNRSNFERSKWNAVIALVGRAVDIGAAIAESTERPSPEICDRALKLKSLVSNVREAIANGELRGLDSSSPKSNSPTSLFDQLEDTVNLIPSVLVASQAEWSDAVASDNAQPPVRLFVDDAFSNPEYVRYALAGTAASMLCYVVYVGLQWPGISTAVTTCVLTALSDVGSSRQKQMLRIGGAAFGGFVFGLGSQIFILPYVDSIVGLAILFAVVTWLSAYIATSSPRLSYAGLQMAFAFYLINVTDFSLSLDLTIGRDRAVGVLLGICAMWLVFERLYRHSAANEMVRMFARSSRLVANLRHSSQSGTDPRTLKKLRDEIATAFNNVNAEADAVPFETGMQREADLAARQRIKSWLSTLRTIYLLELPLITGGLGVESPPALLPAADNRDKDNMWEPLIRIADALELQLTQSGFTSQISRNPVEHETNTGSASSPNSSCEETALPQASRLICQLEHDVLKQPVFEV